MSALLSKGAVEKQEGLSPDESKTEKDYYYTQNIKTIFDLGAFNLIINVKGIFFDEKHGEITAPREYNHLDTEFNYNNAYRIKDDSNNTYYFRFGWVAFIDNQTFFQNVKWLDDKNPPPTESFKEFTISVVELKLVQFGKTTLCTIGDSQTWWNNAQHLRKSINSTFSDLVFIGSNTDIYGYGHEGEGGNGVDAVLKRMNHIPKADYYTLLLGTNDWKNDVESTALKMQKIANQLVILNPDSIILYLTPLPTTNTERDAFNQELSENLLLKFKDIPTITVLDVRGKMKEHENWATAYLSSDGLHQNSAGVEMMGKLIGEKIKHP